MKKERKFAEVLIQHKKPRTFKEWWKIILQVADKHKQLRGEKRHAIW